MPLPPISSALRIASTGLSAQRVRMDVIAQNIANAETTRTAEGGPYRRRVVQMEAEAAKTTAPDATTNETKAADQKDDKDAPGGVIVKSIGIDNTPGPLIYDPGHPDADKTGYVRLPNVNMTDELMDLMSARRIYEANATVFEVAKAMLHRSLDI
jgi:flagellar basal-body rod protein FlgC